MYLTNPVIDVPLKSIGVVSPVAAIARQLFSRGPAEPLVWPVTASHAGGPDDDEFEDGEFEDEDGVQADGDVWSGQ